LLDPYRLLCLPWCSGSKGRKPRLLSGFAPSQGNALTLGNSSVIDARAFYRAYLSFNSAIVPAAVQDVLLKIGKKCFGTRSVLVASMPRSGSTYLALSVAGIPGWRSRSAVPSYGRREYELEAEQIRRDWIASGLNVVYGHHVRCNEHTLAIVDHYEIDVVVLVRNIKDICRSFSDHVDAGHLTWPYVVLDEVTLRHVDRSGLRPSLVASTLLPWLLNFYVGWKLHEQAGGRVLFVRYEDLVDNSVGSLVHLMDYIGTSVNEQTIENAIESVSRTPRQGNMNVGVIGRGEGYFRGEPIADALIEVFLSSYPSIDFSPILA